MMLEHLAPWDYHGVRRALGHGSGFDSPGFRRTHELSPVLAQAFERLLARRGLDLARLYRESHANEDFFQLAERLVDWDQRLIAWRTIHLRLVERIIGGQVIGTQGTPVEVLGRRLDVRYFQSLWDVRNALTAEAQTSPDPEVALHASLPLRLGSSVSWRYVPGAPAVFARDRRGRTFGAGPGAAGTVYDMLNEDKRKAIEIIVEGRAEGPILKRRTTSRRRLSVSLAPAGGRFRAEMMFEFEGAHRALHAVPIAVMKVADDGVIVLLAQLPADLVALNGDARGMAGLGEFSRKHASHPSYRMPRGVIDTVPGKVPLVNLV